MVWKEKGGPVLEAMPKCPGLRARFCRLLLSTTEDVLEARLSLVLKQRQNRHERWQEIHQEHWKHFQTQHFVPVSRCTESSPQACKLFLQTFVKE